MTASVFGMGSPSAMRQRVASKLQARLERKGFQPGPGENDAIRSDVDTATDQLAAALNEQLGQPFLHLELAGPLLDREGRRIGFAGVFEAANFDVAAAYLAQSPYFRAGLYERTELAEFSIEVGRLE